MLRAKILITGASSGLGAEMARQFARQGRDLALCARRLDRLEELKAELTSLAPAITVEVATLDVTDHQSVVAVFGDLDARLGGIDRVVVNAGIGSGAKIGTGRAEDNLATVRTNLVGALSQTEAALEIFRARGQGHLVLVSSIAGIRGLPGTRAAYAASKAGVSSLGEALAIEFAGTPIAVTTLLPGFIETELSARVKTAADQSAPLSDSVATMVEAIEKERRRVPLPGLKWKLIDRILRYSPFALVRRIV